MRFLKNLFYSAILNECNTKIENDRSGYFIPGLLGFYFGAIENNKAAMIAAFEAFSKPQIKLEIQRQVDEKAQHTKRM
jgi:hypothetical protein